jgi:GntR family transcriptional repressor for pyruvate dehydrogenase complex
MFKQRTTRDELLAQHRTINAAVQRRDPAGAQAAVEAHLNYVRGCLEDQNRATLNEDYAQRRFYHEQRRQ